MTSTWKWILVTVLVCLAHGISSANACSKTVEGRTFVECQDLASLGATFAWSFNQTANSIAFAFTEAMSSSSGWVGWGINPTGTQMPGTQALIAFKNSSEILTVKEYDVTEATLSGTALQPGNVSVNYTDLEAELSGTTATIFGTILLTKNQSTTLNHVWNQGPSVDTSKNDTVAAHPVNSANLASSQTINMLSGESTAISAPHLKLKNSHGIVNAVAWGILLPIGVMAARYLRPFAWADPLWFYLHVSCQITGYILGVVGFGLGLKLQKYAAGLIHYKHRNLGVGIFVLATLQMLAIILRPKKDAKVRPYWNVYHHTIGYATIILIIVNIFEGIDILQPQNKWKVAYIVVLIILAIIALVLEVVTWIAWFQRRQTAAKRMDEESSQRYVAGPGQYRQDGV